MCWLPRWPRSPKSRPRCPASPLNRFARQNTPGRASRKTKMPKAGRYDTAKATHMGDLPAVGLNLDRKLNIVHAAVDDPNRSIERKLGEQRRQMVAVNLHTDMLETELHYGRISQAAYELGRRYLRILEAAAGQENIGAPLEPSTGSGDRDAT